jgi:hypothetical protein
MPSPRGSATIRVESRDAGDYTHLRAGPSPAISMTPSSADSPTILPRLMAVLAGRRDASPESSYVAGLYRDGPERIREKIDEESRELIAACTDRHGASRRGRPGVSRARAPELGGHRVPRRGNRAGATVRDERSRGEAPAKPDGRRTAWLTNPPIPRQGRQ